MSYHPHTQTLTVSSVSVDALCGWHRPFVTVKGGLITSEITSTVLHVSGPPTAAAPYLGTYSTVFDGGVHVTGDSSVPFLSDGPVTITYDMVANPVQDNWAATVDYVKAQLNKSFTVHLPVLAIYNVGDPNMDPPVGPVPTNGDRIITFKSGETTTNNHVWTYDLGSLAWVDGGSLEADNGITVALTQNSDVIPGYPTYVANDTIIFSDALDPLNTNDVLTWTRWFLNFDHDYIANNGYNPSTGVGLRHATINSWLNQSVKQAAIPTFAGISLIDTSGINILEIFSPRFLTHQLNLNSAAGSTASTGYFPPLTPNGTWTLLVTVSSYSAGGRFSGEQLYMLSADATVYTSITPLKKMQTKVGAYSTAVADLSTTGTTSIIITVGNTVPATGLAVWTVRIRGVSAKP